MLNVIFRRVLLSASLALACGACASTGAVPRPFPGASTPAPGVPAPPAALPPAAAPPTTAGSPAGTLDSARADLVATALALRGTPYRNGGSDPSGFDCSGFVQYVFARHATRLPREAWDQYHAGLPIALDEVQPGDLVFFETVAQGPSHVGLVIGGNQFVHAPSSRGVVRIESYASTYWAPRLVGARRVFSSTAAAAPPPDPPRPAARPPG